MNIDQWNEYIKGIGNYQENIFINMDAKEMIVKILNGDFEFDWKDISIYWEDPLGNFLQFILVIKILATQLLQVPW